MKVLENSYKFLVTTNDFDYKDDFRPSAVLNYFQVVAGMHASEIGVGFDVFKVRNLAWVLVKIKYRCIEEAKPDTHIIVKTWPKEPKRVEHDRLYQIKDINDNVLFEGLSRWCVIDFNTRRISRETSLYNGEFINDDVDLVFDTDIIKSNDFELLDYMFDYVVRLSDLDHNGHMNNTKYGDIVLSLTQEGKHIEEFEINFVNECLLGQTIKIYKKEINDKLFVIGQNSTNSRIAFKALLQYSK